MKIVAFSLVLDGMPTLAWHLPMLNMLKIPWHWYVIEGAAMNVNCSAWCQPQKPRLSLDGTHEYLEMIKSHPCVTVISKESWNGKNEMVNAALSRIKEPCVLMQIDSDEHWTAAQLETIVKMFEDNPDAMRAYFYCRYFVGLNLIAVGDGYGNKFGEWLRAFRFQPSWASQSHEPPVINNNRGAFLDRELTKSLGLVFEHWAYALPNAVAFKENYYGYKDALYHWSRLQEVKNFPVKLRDYFHWVKEGVMVEKINS